MISAWDGVGCGFDGALLMKAWIAALEGASVPEGMGTLLAGTGSGGERIPAVTAFPAAVMDVHTTSTSTSRCHFGLAGAYFLFLSTPMR